LRRLDIPGFLRREPVPARLFERNYLPGDTQVAFRTALFRGIGGYDLTLSSAESFDLLLRAVARRAHFSYGPDAGYRMYAYSGSLSRNLAQQRAGLAAALRKHDYAAVRELCLEAGQAPRVAAWVLVSMALFRDEPLAALQFLDEASPASADKEEVLEADGPWPLPEGWRRSFQLGTILLLLGGHDAEAAEELRRAHATEPTAEVSNNLGVALSRLGAPDEATALFTSAARSYPGYLDARLNLQGPLARHITTHSFRRQASRSEY